MLSTPMREEFKPTLWQRATQAISRRWRSWRQRPLELMNQSHSVAYALVEEYRTLSKSPSDNDRIDELVRQYQARVLLKTAALKRDNNVAWLNDDEGLLDALFEHVHSLPPHQRPTALCLSGGGIRSASFCLGVLQGLAMRRRLRHFTYLSTVSGGGYIGGWLSNWLRLNHWQIDKISHALAGTAVGKEAPRQSDAMEARTDPTHDPVSRLRAYTNYLSPTLGLSGDFLGLVGTFVRNLTLNWFVWLPLIAATLLLPRLFVAILTPEAAPSPNFLTGVGVVAAALQAAGIAYVVADLPGESRSTPPHVPAVKDWFKWLCLLPLVAGAMVASLAGGLVGSLSWQLAANHVAWTVAAQCGGVLLGMVFRVVRKPGPMSARRRWATMGMLVFAGAVLGLLLAVALSYAFNHRGRRDDAAVLYATLSMPLMLGSLWLATTVCAGFVRRWTDEDDREWWARAGGWWLLSGAAWGLLFWLVCYLTPWVLTLLSASLPAGAQLSAGAAALGVVTSLVGYWSSNGDKLTAQAKHLAARLGVSVLALLAGAVLLALLLAMNLGLSQLMQNRWSEASQQLTREVQFFRSEAVAQSGSAADPQAVKSASEASIYTYVLLNSSTSMVGASLVVFAGVGLAVSWAIGANAFSLHGMYGNRLVRAYLGTARQSRQPHWMTGFDPDDNPPLASFLRPPAPPWAPPQKSSPQRLFPVVNMALNLVLPAQDRLGWQQRKAASFTATPLRCGNDRTGYVPTARYGGRGNGMSMGRAMAISGAAASPNMGYHTSPLVALVMTLFNVRLGWWLGNPRRKFASLWTASEPRLGIKALFDEAFSRTTDSRGHVHLSDGGHFENLGLYEMVRRRCHRIVVVDATCDPRFEYADLHDAVRKIRIDFGIRVELPSVFPGQDPTDKGRLLVGRIHYADRDPNAPVGHLYLLKPLLTGCEPPDVRDYARRAGSSGGAFPHQSTSDQFFDEDQFESYRMLGLQTLLEAWPVRSSWPPTPARWGDPCAPPAKAATGDAEGAAKPGAAGGFADWVSKLSPATVAAVAGTAGVIGTLGVSSVELSLSNEDRALLRDNLAAMQRADVAGLVTSAASAAGWAASAAGLAASSSGLAASTTSTAALAADAAASAAAVAASAARAAQATASSAIAATQAAQASTGSAASAAGSAASAASALAEVGKTVARSTDAAASAGISAASAARSAALAAEWAASAARPAGSASGASLFQTFGGSRMGRGQTGTSR